MLAVTSIIKNKGVLSRLLLAVLFIFVVISTSSVSTSSIHRQISPVKSIFVSSDPVLLEFNGEESDWLIETQPDRILFLSFPDSETSNILKNSLTIYDGLGQFHPQQKFYSTGNSVTIRFRRSEALLQTPSVKYQLKIQKAVDCPVNLGGQSSCGRAVDDVSCYCSTFAGKTWADTRAFCHTNQMTFLRVNNYEEDLAIWRTWGGLGIELWIGANDINGEGYFVWDNGGVPLSPGYTNWGPNEPNNGVGNPEPIPNEDCIHYGWFEFAWNDYNCTYLFGGICEAQP